MEGEAIYKYHFRPGYGSDYFLVEIFSGAEKDNFLTDFLNAIAAIDAKITDVDLLMNDGIVTAFESKPGRFTLLKDFWGLAYVMADENQDAILKIHQLLSADLRFENVPARSDYTTIG